MNRTEVLHLVIVPLAVLTVIGVFLWFWLKKSGPLGCAGGHPFDELTSRIVSPDGKYVVELRAFGDDCDAFSGWSLAATRGRQGKQFDLDVVGIDGVEWVGKHDLLIRTDPDWTRSASAPTHWGEVRIAYVATKRGSPRAEPSP